MLMILAPFINYLLVRVGQQIAIMLGIFSIVVAFIVPTFVNFQFNLIPAPQFFFVMFMYALGGYVRLYPSRLFTTPAYALGLMIFALWYYTVQVQEYIQLALHNVKDVFNYLGIASAYGSVSSLVPVLVGFSIFIIFLNLKLTFNPIINQVASTAFGIYCQIIIMLGHGYGEIYFICKGM